MLEAPSISRLDQSVISRIAAGEVINQPSSAIKELIENSIDAGSTSIIVSIENGGYSLMRIKDNGSGINPKDLPIACARHTTSKLKSYTDLENISTFGFRGEALFSMSCCSHLSIQTKIRSEQTGFRGDFLNGNLINDVVKTPMTNGTIIEMKDLFYNNKLRLDGRPKVTVDTRKVTDLVSKYAIAYPAISFLVNSNNKEAIQTYGQSDTLSVMKLLFHVDDNKTFIHLSHEYSSNIQAKIIINSPSVSPKKRLNSIFVNGRLISHSGLKRGIENAYGDLVAPGVKPMFFVQLTMPQEIIDVNIHPSKKVIKFIDETLIINSICEKIRSSLEERKFTRPINSLPVKSTQKTKAIISPAQIKPITDYIVDEKKEEIPVFTNNESVIDPVIEIESNNPTVLIPSFAEDDIITMKTSDIGDIHSFSGVPDSHIDEEVLHSSSSRFSFNKPLLIENTTKERVISERPKTIRTIPDIEKPKEYAPVFEKPKLNIIERNTRTEISDMPDCIEELPAPIVLSPKPNKHVTKIIEKKQPTKNSLFEEIKHDKKQNQPENEIKMKTLEQLFVPPSIIPKTLRTVELLSILQMRSHRNEYISSSLSKILQNHRLTGFIGLTYALLQSGDSLYIVNLFGLLKDVFTQCILDLFMNFPQIRLEKPVSIQEILESYTEDTKSASEFLTSKSAILMDYFSISIDKGILYSMPEIIKGYKPSYSSLPYFLTRLVTSIDWDNEESCLRGIINELACASSPVKEDERDEILTSQIQKDIQNIILPMAQSGNYSPSMDAVESIAKIHTISSMYQLFS